MFPDSLPEMIIIPVTETEIICIIASLKNKNSSGYDGISNKILKLCGDYLGKLLPCTWAISEVLCVISL
jgi:hypothetical protein